MKSYSIEHGFHTDWGDPIDHLLADIRKYPSLTVNAFGDILLSPYIPIAFGNVTNASIKEYLSNDIFGYWDSKPYSFIRGQLVNYDKMDACKLLGIKDLNEGVIMMDILEENIQKKLNNLYGILKEKENV